jgi:hypothetical protein
VGGYLDGEARPGQTVLDVRDTEAGRVVLYGWPPCAVGAGWMMIAPPLTAQVEQGVRSVLASG